MPKEEGYDPVLLACYAGMIWLVCYIIYSNVFNRTEHRSLKQFFADQKAKVKSKLKTKKSNNQIKVD